jgi:hypothetical protein
VGLQQEPQEAGVEDVDAKWRRRASKPDHPVLLVCLLVPNQKKYPGAVYGAVYGYRGGSVHHGRVRFEQQVGVLGCAQLVG